MECTAIILCGGQGKRAGGLDKGLIEHDGKALIDRVIDRLRPQVGSIIISANRNLESYRARGYRVVTDRHPDHQGPLAGLSAALEVCETDQLLLAPCDIPALPEELADRLVPALEHADIAYAFDGVRGQYLVAAMKMGVAGPLRAYMARGDRTVHRWYKEMGARSVDFSDCPSAFRNLNSPAET